MCIFYLIPGSLSLQFYVSAFHNPCPKIHELYTCVFFNLKNITLPAKFLILCRIQMQRMAHQKKKAATLR